MKLFKHQEEALDGLNRVPNENGVMFLDRTYGTYVWYKNHDYTILEWEDYMEEKVDDLRELLKPCYVVEHRNGSLSLVISVKDVGLVLCSFNGSWNGLYYDSNLIYNGTNPSSVEDIMKIYGFSLYGNKNSLFQQMTEILFGNVRQKNQKQKLN